MIDGQLNQLKYLVIIAEKNNKEEFLSLLKEYGARSIETTYCHGSAPNSITAAFGFASEQNKVQISCLTKHHSAEKLIDILYNKYNFNKPNTGIAFTIPIEGLSF